MTRIPTLGRVKRERSARGRLGEWIDQSDESVGCSMGAISGIGSGTAACLRPPKDMFRPTKIVSSCVVRRIDDPGIWRIGPWIELSNA